MTAAGWPGVRSARRAAQWGKQKYAGSLAEDVWRRLDTMDFINRGMVFAATLLLCLFPFLIVVSALAGRPAAQSLTRYTGLNGQAAADIGHLFASSAATARRALFPAACATGVLYVAMQTVFSLVFSAMVISNEHTYGPIGTIFALLSYLIAIGVVVILGAVVGRAWHERSAPSTKAHGAPATARSCRGSEVSPPPSDVQPPGCRSAGATGRVTARCPYCVRTP